MTLPGGEMWLWLMMACSDSPADRTRGQLPPPPAPVEERQGKAGKQRRPPDGRQAGRDAPESPTRGELPTVADPCAAWAAPGMYELTLPGRDSTRTLVAVPKGPGPHRVAVLLHGGHGGPEEILTQTRMLQMVDEWNVVVVAPSGAGGATEQKSNWNSRDTPGMTRDDVAYLDRLTREVKQRTCGAQVLAVGFSNGAMMANRWLCQGDTPDAALTGAGRIGVEASTCKEGRPHLNYVGTDDDQYRSDHPNTADTLDLWAKLNGCRGEAKTEVSGRVTVRSWDGCAQPTEQHIIEGFPHAWPMLGTKSDSPVDATKEGWAWFTRVMP